MQCVEGSCTLVTLLSLFALVYKVSLWFTCVLSVNVCSFLPFSPCLLVDVILTMFCYNQRCSYLHHVYTLLQWEDLRAFILTHSTQWFITGVQDIHRCDWLHYSKLQKHVVNDNLWHILERRLEDEGNIQYTGSLADDYWIKLCSGFSKVYYVGTSLNFYWFFYGLGSTQSTNQNKV